MVGCGYFTKDCCDTGYCFVYSTGILAGGAFF